MGRQARLESHPELRKLTGRCLAVLLLICVGASSCGNGAAPALRVATASVEVAKQSSLVIALDFRPHPDVLAALDHGVPLRFEISLGGRDARNRVAFERHVLELSFQPLVRQWQLARIDASGETPRLFASRGQLLAAIDHVRLPLHQDWLTLSGVREYSLRVRVPQSSLPGPLRLPAWFSRTWRIDSGEVMWTTP